ncbi:unnamed protein product [Ectocarpus sp. 12 AP-2014]
MTLGQGEATRRPLRLAKEWRGGSIEKGAWFPRKAEVLAQESLADATSLKAYNFCHELSVCEEVFIFDGMDGAYKRETFILARQGRGAGGGRCFTADFVRSGEISALGGYGMGRRGDSTRPIFVNPET